MVVLLTRLVLPQQLLHQLLHQGKQQLTLMEKVIKISVLDIHVLMVVEVVVPVVLGSNRPLGPLLVLAVLVMGSALYAIRIKHDNRSMTTEIERARVERERLQMEWSQLQLEEAALAHHARIESAARDQLGMAEPREYVILQQSAAERVP